MAYGGFPIHGGYHGVPVNHPVEIGIFHPRLSSYWGTKFWDISIRTARLSGLAGNLPACETVKRAEQGGSGHKPWDLWVSISDKTIVKNSLWIFRPRWWHPHMPHDVPSFCEDRRAPKTERHGKSQAEFEHCAS